MLRLTLLLLISAAPAFGNAAAHAQPNDGFYLGKTVKIVIGTTMGGEYGLYSQLIAQHIGRFVPGKPTVIVQTVPGGGGINALNYVANVAPRDGTVLSVPHLNIVQDGLLNPKMRFDPGKFQWIGRLREQQQVGVASSRSNVRSLADAKTREVVAGGVAHNNPTALNPRILNVLVGTKFKIVTGYKGTHEISIAWERGEVDVLTTSWDTFTRRYGEQVKQGLINPLYVYAMQRPQELAHVPLITEYGRNEGERAFLQIYTVGTEIGRSLAAPPGVPKERVDVWRAAFVKMLDDPEFKSAVSKGNIPINPLNGETLASLVAKVVTLPIETIDGARKFYDRLLDEAQSP
jgi:tripartite-type tricarboxylate transporter receptor subunit TctC